MLRCFKSTASFPKMIISTTISERWNALDALAEDECNDALLLYLNTPGGNMYESDELYHALMMYREKTGRPIYGYMAQECCSAACWLRWRRMSCMRRG